MRSFKRIIRDWFRTLGYEISPYDGSPRGRDAHTDMRHLVCAERPVVFDVGANQGQSVDDFKKSFPNARIHSFEPFAAIYELLKAKAATYADVFPNRMGLGRRQEQRLFVEYTTSIMNSFLLPGADGSAYGQVKSESLCEVTTVDAYCEQAGVTEIDVLKVDAQGLDLEVLEGAVSMMSRHRVHVVYIELLFSQIYEGQASATDIMRFMEERGFRLVSFYRFIYLNDLASWSDAIFVDPQFAPAPH